MNSKSIEREKKMKRNAFALKVGEGLKYDFRQGVGSVWKKICDTLDSNGGSNFSMWQIEDVVFCYYESDDDNSSVAAGLFDAFGEIDDTFEWISDPKSEMRLMYHDFGIVREDKSLIRHRMFVTRLKEGFEEDYKSRHDALVEARGGVPDPGPDSNFSIWYAGGYIMGYDEIDTTMESEETQEQHEATVKWETRMLEIMDWMTDDVDWLTGEHHDHVVRIGYHSRNIFL